MDKTKTAVDVFNRFADAYQDKFMDVSAYGKSLDLFCEQLSAHAEILELACGPGNITRYLLDQKPGLRILGTDLAPNMITLARINNPEATFQIMDCRDIGKLEAMYDGILCGFVLPYLSKEEALRLIADASALLRQSGVFYLSTMEDDYSKSGPEISPSGNTIYMHYHEAGYLEDALVKNNFRIVDLRRQDFVKPDGSKMTDLIIVAQKN